MPTCVGLARGSITKSHIWRRATVTDKEFEAHMERYNSKRGEWVAWFFVGLLTVTLCCLPLCIRWNIVWDRIQNGPYDMRFFN